MLAGAVSILVLPLSAARRSPRPRAWPRPWTRSLGKGAPIKAGRVKIELPELAENGNSVPLQASPSTAP